MPCIRKILITRHVYKLMSSRSTVTLVSNSEKQLYHVVGNSIKFSFEDINFENEYSLAPKNPPFLLKLFLSDASLNHIYNISISTPLGITEWYY